MISVLQLSPPLFLRFLRVRPASVEDERLLGGIVAFLNAYFKQTDSVSDPASDPQDEDLRWTLELLLNQVQALKKTKNKTVWRVHSCKTLHLC